MKQKYFSILILDIISLISSLQIIISKQYIFSTQEYIGIILLLISTILFFIDFKSYKYIYLITLLLGIFGYISFSSFYITFGSSTIRIHLIPLLILIVYIFIDKINPLDFYTTPTEKEEYSINLVKTFERRFKKLSDSEINMKLNENLTSEAIKALINIKNRRNNKKI